MNCLRPKYGKWTFFLNEGKLLITSFGTFVSFILMFFPVYMSSVFIICSFYVFWKFHFLVKILFPLHKVWENIPLFFFFSSHSLCSNYPSSRGTNQSAWLLISSGYISRSKPQKKLNKTTKQQQILIKIFSHNKYI